MQSVVWNGSILLPESTCVQNISIRSSSKEIPQSWPAEATLNFLSVVETARIPLHVVLGTPCLVTTTNADSQRWFRDILFSTGTDRSDSSTEFWWNSARPDSPLGILLGVPGISQGRENARPQITELLVFATQESATRTGRLPTPRSSPGLLDENGQSLNTPEFRILAVPLSSDLLQSESISNTTPPASPAKSSDKIEGTFIECSFDSIETAEFINRPPVRKRKSVTDAFDAASERVRKARRQGGEGVAAAAASATKPEDALPSLKHRRSVSNSQPVPLQTRPQSRASSVTSAARPASARELPVPALAKRSSLSRVKSVIDGVTASEAETETRNKELVSKIVMAGMRLHGLSQSKPRRSLGGVVPAEVDVDDIEMQRKKDEEYKLVYHQVHKGTCFAFRQYLANESLNPHTGAVRETVDKLLLLYCTDPLTPNTTSEEKDLTPGGRKIFGSAALAS